MVTIEIPGAPDLRVGYLVLDFNGTLAMDGRLLPGVGQRLRSLARRLRILVLTADTFGHAATELDGLPLELRILPPGDQDEAKRRVVAALDAGVVAVGNGRNDAGMLRQAALGVCVVQQEGASGATLQAADVVSSDITHALDLLLHPRRLQATLRR